MKKEKTKDKSEKKIMRLDEITIMRPILICVFLVGYHAFAPWGGVWQMPEDIDKAYVPAYYWLDKFLYSFMLETFVFISGYLFAYQLFCMERRFKLRNILENKGKRLMVPSIVFSILYSLISYKSDFGIIQYVYDILCGLGHLWFLPMLFECFLFTYLIEKLRLDYNIKLIALLLLSIIASGYVNEIPFRLGLTAYYLFYFYLAFGVLRYRTEIRRKYTSRSFVWFVIALYAITFIFFTYSDLYKIVVSDSDIGHRIIKYGMLYASRCIYSTLGVFAFYLMTMRFSSMGFCPSKFMEWLNPLCMGIYLIHNFAFRIIYDKSVLPDFLGTYFLPWIAYLIALLTGISITGLLKNTTIGNKLC